ncbi:WbqC family protein [Arcobacter sp.]|uniref:WbqC family protein n=1 Tax=Arcobacter sp. TaxID=1872629 RepID=UPI003D0DA997
MKKNNIVISQPMYFPWIGLFEQIRFSDIFVIYDDAQFSKGSFTNRVQIKTNTGMKWLSVPISKLKLGQKINEIQIDNKKNWKRSHIDFLKNTYKNHPYLQDVLSIINHIYSNPYNTMSDLSTDSIKVILEYFEIERKILFSSSMKLEYTNSDKVLEIVKLLNGNVYITGHGAKNYLNHEDFEKNNIDVKYINYNLRIYPQKFETFTPYVSILDLIANVGKDGLEYFNSVTLNWKEFINDRNREI